MLLLLLSIFPVLVILFYLYKKDKYEKEPTKILLKAFVGGVLAAISTIILFIILDLNTLNYGNHLFDALFNAFIFAAIPEESFKFLFLFWFIWKNKNFNENYDGIIYAAYVSLGFACLENIFYVFEHGVGVGISRAIFAVPAHAIFGVIMGYYFSKMKFDIIDKNKHFLKALGFAILAHGIYDFLLFYASAMDEYSAINIIVLIVFLAFFIKIFKTARWKIKKHVESSVFK